MAFVGNEADGSFDASDYLLFYGRGPHTIRQNGAEFEHVINDYCDTSYYFIRIDGAEPAKRVTNQAQSAGAVTHTVTDFNEYQFIEIERFNFWESGKEWFGDTYSSVKDSYTYNFSVPNITSDSVKLYSKFASRSVVGNSFTITAPGASQTVGLGTIAGLPYEYAKTGSSTLYFDNAPSSITVTAAYDLAGSLTAEGYMDEMRLNARRNLVMSGTSMGFRDIESVGIGNVAEFQLTGATQVTEIWDVTDAHNISSIDYTDLGSLKTFTANTDSLKEFVAITASGGSAPFSFGAVQNQNLHALPYADVILVSPGN